MTDWFEVVCLCVMRHVMIMLGVTLFFFSLFLLVGENQIPFLLKAFIVPMTIVPTAISLYAFDEHWRTIQYDPHDISWGDVPEVPKFLLRKK